MLDVDTLKARVRATLSNDEYMESQYDALYAQAIAECEGIVGDKALAHAFWLDIAYFRFLTLVDSVDESDWKRYKAALDELKRAPLKSASKQSGAEAVPTTATVKVARRKGAWL